MTARLRQLTGAGANHWLDVEESFVHADFQDASDHIFGLAGIVAPEITDLELPEPHITGRTRDDFVREAMAPAAGDVLVPVVGRSHEAAQHMIGFPAATPGASGG